MQRQIILLAGLHKTATTSIQQTCAANLPLLRAAGFDYPLAEFDGRWESNHTRLLNALFRREPNKHGLQSQFTVAEDLKPGSQEQFRESFATMIAGAQRLVLVAEGVSVLDGAELQVMRDWFEQRGWQLRVMCHVRHISSWFSSMVGQRVAGLSRMTVGSAIEEFRRHGSIVRGRIESLRKAFPDVEFYSHERAVRHVQGPVGFFFQNIGLAPGPQLRIVRANEGRSDCATRALSIINEKFGPFTADGGMNRTHFSGPAIDRLLDEVRGGKFRLREPEVAPVLDMLGADNDWLREQLGDEFHDPAIGFKPAIWNWNPQVVESLWPVLDGMPAPVRKWVLGNLPRIGIEPGPRGAPSPKRGSGPG